MSSLCVAMGGTGQVTRERARLNGFSQEGHGFTPSRAVNKGRSCGCHAEEGGGGSVEAQNKKPSHANGSRLVGGKAT